MTSAPLHTYEVTAGWACVYSQPTTYSQNRRRVTRGMRLKGAEVIGAKVRGSRAWVELAEGGYILLSRVRAVDMDDARWLAFLDTLTPGQRHLVQGVMARVQTILNNDRVLEIEDVQGLEDKAMNQQRQIRADELRQDDTDARLDADEERLDRLEAGG